MNRRLMALSLPPLVISLFAFAVWGVVFSDFSGFEAWLAAKELPDWLENFISIWANFQVDYWINLIRLRVDSALTLKELLIWEFSIIGIFLASYFSPSKWRPSLHQLGFWLVFLLVYPWQFALFFLFLIYVFYVMSHPDGLKITPHALALVGGTVIVALLAGGAEERIAIVSTGIVAALFWWMQRASRDGLSWMRLRAPTIVPTTLFFVAVFFSKPIFAGSVNGWQSAIALFLFLNFGLRMLFHYFEQRDGQIGRSMEFSTFLNHFAMLPDFIFPVWWLHPGQGVHYLKTVYLRRPYEEIILDGVKSLLVGILYLAVFVPLPFVLLTILSTSMGYSYPLLGELYEAYLLEKPVPFMSFILATIWGFVLFSSSLLGVLHFKVGLYRLFGYDIESYTRFPWIATTFPDFWKRYGYHYMQMILRGYYLPVFLKLRNYPLKLRIAVAAAYAFFVGQFVTWSIYRMDGLNVYKFAPYFLLLSIATIVSFWWGAVPRSDVTPREPWTLDWQLPLDVAKVIGIFLFFAIAHLFYHPEINAHGRWAWHLIEYVLK